MNYDFDRDTPKSAYDALYEKPIGYVFSVNPDDYETVMGRISDGARDGFAVFPIMPGTSLYVQYGCDHCVVTTK
jgi:hypothetical protein